MTFDLFARVLLLISGSLVLMWATTFIKDAAERNSYTVIGILFIMASQLIHITNLLEKLQ